MVELKNRYLEELKKMERQQIKVKDFDGNEYEGECLGINYMHLNIVLMTKDEKIIIKNPQVIRRTRTVK